MNPVSSLGKIFSSIEPLEDRIAPASILVGANYDAATGELALSCSNNAGHVVKVFQTGVNAYRVDTTSVAASISTVGSGGDKLSVAANNLFVVPLVPGSITNFELATLT